MASDLDAGRALIKHHLPGARDEKISAFGAGDIGLVAPHHFGAIARKQLDRTRPERCQIGGAVDETDRRLRRRSY
jgi:hypothetical protein